MKSITQVVQNLIKPYIDSHDRAAEAIIAPVETDATSASDDYTVGKQLILNDVLYDVIAPITTGDAIVVNTNIKAADNVSSDIEALTNNLADEVSARAKLGAHNLGKKFKDGVTSIGLTIKDAPDGGNYMNGTATGSGGRLNLTSDNFVLKAGTYSIVGESNDHSKYSSVVLQKTSDNSVLGSYLISNGVVDKSQATVTLAADTECYFGFNTTTGAAYGTDTFIIYPMVRFADDKDDTFYPYAKTNRELTAENQTLTNEVTEESAIRNVLGAKNIFPNKLVSGTYLGVIYENNGDGTITANGTFSELGPVLLSNGWSDTDLSWITPFIGKKIRLKSGVVGLTFTISFYDSSNTETKIESGYNGTWGEGTVPSGIHHYAAYLFPSGTITLTDALIFPRADYEPYAMTNRELTDELTTSIGTSGITFNTTNCQDIDNSTSITKYGKICILNLNVKSLSSAAGSNVDLLTLPSGYRPSGDVKEAILITSNLIPMVTVASNGTVRYYSGDSIENWPIRGNIIFIVP